eukprot:NODE_456_length_1671_cov_127.315043_g332_i0.p1 GENE.NODE_456_length_1671_cov_127.315043_g332_i0~~NODE_456_length_1671_cov_127.315043_g332_i0.p1  ORF type:complete len:534 (+),score=178.34 NODE_456_length_1671_cov_127.315043_g332_i0:55-1602(+)
MSKKGKAVVSSPQPRSPLVTASPRSPIIKKKPATPSSKAVQIVKKNVGLMVVLATIVAFGLCLLMQPAAPRNKKQVKAEENMKATLDRLESVANNGRSEVKAGWTDMKAVEDLWESFTVWQRKYTRNEVSQQVVPELKKAIGRILNAGDLGRLFGSATPDIQDESFLNSAGQVWSIYSAWQSGFHFDPDVMGDTAYSQLNTVIDHGFWGGMEMFTSEESRGFSLQGWNITRGVMLARFFKKFQTVMNGHLTAVQAGQALNIPDEPAPEPIWSEEPGAQDVAHMTDATFDETVKSKKHALVMFYAPWCGHCKKLKPDYQQAATVLKGQDVVIGAIDADAEKGTASTLKVEGYPTIHYFANGAPSGKFEGRSLIKILEFLADATRMGSVLDGLVKEHTPEPEIEWADQGNDVLHMTDDSFNEDILAKDHTLVMFYAPWCGHCTAFKPAYAEAATLLKDSAANVAAVDAIKHAKAAKDFEIKGFPTILYFEKGQKKDAYEGARTAEAVVEFLQKKMAP